jgi:WD40 repeat protein
MQILTGLGSWPVGMAFSPDGRYLAAGDSNAFHLWDLSAGSDPLWSATDYAVARNFCFTPEGASVVGGYYSRFARYDVRTGAQIDEPFLAELGPQQFSPDGRFALAANPDRGTHILRMKCARATPDGWAEAWQKDIAYDPEYEWSGYRALFFSADGGRFVRTAGRARSTKNVAPIGVEVFDAATGERLAEWTGELPAWMRQGAADAAGTVALIHYRALFAIDTTDPKSKLVKKLNASPKHFTSVAFTRDGTRLATTSNDTAATVWDTATWEVRRRYAWDIGRLRTVCFAPDGLRCAAGSDTGQVVVWDLDD